LFSFFTRKNPPCDGCYLFWEHDVCYTFDNKVYNRCFIYRHETMVLVDGNSGKSLQSPGTYFLDLLICD